MKTAVITGGGRGLGRLIAHKIARKGFAVLVTDIDEDSARQTADSIGASAWSMKQDVRDATGHRRVAEAASSRGPLTVWVNNAGVLKTGAAWEIDDGDVQRQVEINVLGVMWGSRAAVDHMRDNGGHIINIASMSSLVPVPGLAAYGATKHAVLGYTTSLAGELALANLPIRVSALCPDAIDTNLVHENAHDEQAGLLFSSGKLLSPDKVSDLAVGLIDDPRLVVAYPQSRALLAHLLRPFPALSLKLLEQFRKVGERNRRRHNGS